MGRSDVDVQISGPRLQRSPLPFDTRVTAASDHDMCIMNLRVFPCVSSYLGMNIFVAFFLLLLLLADSTPPAASSVPLIGRRPKHHGNSMATRFVTMATVQNVKFYHGCSPHTWQIHFTCPRNGSIGAAPISCAQEQNYFLSFNVQIRPSLLSVGPSRPNCRAALCSPDKRKRIPFGSIPPFLCTPVTRTNESVLLD